MAENITNYINRAGRTGRNGIKGESKSIFYICSNQFGGGEKSFSF
jgi:superfamily II DNA/RNA helicase